MPACRAWPSRNLRLVRSWYLCVGVFINGKDGGCDESDHGIPSSFVSVLFCRVSQAFELIFRSPGIVYLILLFKSLSHQSVVHRIVAHTRLRPSPYAGENL